MNRLENNPVITLSPGACLRVAASAKAGERAGVRGAYHVHPHLNPPPSRGRRIILAIFIVRR